MLNPLLPKLNFPEYVFRYKKNPSGQLLIFDDIRKKFIILTPEEWVRQNLIAFLINEKKYPKSLIAVEKRLKLNGTNKRSDIRIYGANKNLILLAECKAHYITLNQKSIEQVMRYELSQHSKIIIVSNGLKIICLKKNTEGKFDFITELPEYSSV
jgi:hypothetical protein